jgi:hypothetical protein
VKLLLKAALHSKLLAAILKQGSESGFTPLVRAVSRGDAEIVKLLLWAGADVESFGIVSTSDTAEESVSRRITWQEMLEQHTKVHDATNSSQRIKELFESRIACQELDQFRQKFPHLLENCFSP